MGVLFGKMASAGLLLVFIVGASVNLVSGGSENQRCFLEDSSNVWPSDECSSFSFSHVSCGSGGCSHEVKFNRTKHPHDGDLSIYRARLQPWCDCICACDCPSSGKDNLVWILKANHSTSQYHPYDRETEPVCLRFYTEPLNISSCCVRFRGQEVETITTKPSKTTEASPEPPEQANRSLIACLIGVIGGVMVVLLAVAVWKARRLGASLPDLPLETNEGSPSETPPSKILIIYHHRFDKKILEGLISGIKTALKHCKVHDYMEDPVLIEYGLLALHEYINTFDKVIFVLSLPHRPFQEGLSANFHDQIFHCFYSKYLPTKRPYKKIICVSLEHFPSLKLENFFPSKIYALPTMLMNFLKVLHFEGDNGITTQIEQNLTTNVELALADNGT